MEIEKQSTETETRVAIVGELTLSSAQELRTELLECLAGERAAELDLTGVTEADLGCLQVLLGAQRSFARHRLQLVIRWGECVRQAWAHAGYPAGEASSG